MGIKKKIILAIIINVIIYAYIIILSSTCSGWYCPGTGSIFYILVDIQFLGPISRWKEVFGIYPFIFIWVIVLSPFYIKKSNKSAQKNFEDKLNSQADENISDQSIQPKIEKFSLLKKTKSINIPSRKYILFLLFRLLGLFFTIVGSIAWINVAITPPDWGHMLELFLYPMIVIGIALLLVGFTHAKISKKSRYIIVLTSLFFFSYISLEFFFISPKIYAKLAAMFNNASVCHLGIRYDSFNSCFVEFAIETNNINRCDDFGDINGYGYRNRCYSEYAKRKDDENLCGLVQSLRFKEDCVTFYAIKQNNEYLCEMLSVPGGELERNYCYTELAIHKKDVSICGHLLDIQEDGVKIVAENHKKSGCVRLTIMSCALFYSQEEEDACYDNMQKQVDLINSGSTKQDGTSSASFDAANESVLPESTIVPLPTHGSFPSVSPTSQYEPSDSDLLNQIWQIKSAASNYYKSHNTYQGLKEYLSSLSFPLDYTLKKYGGENGALNISNDGKSYCIEAYWPGDSTYYCDDLKLDVTHGYKTNPKCSETYFACE